ncbi:MAG: ATP-grasp domain-containing protein [Phycisphaerales bacterium JB040]
MTSVLVLAAGPDAERDVSIESAGAVCKALRDSGRWDSVEYVEIGPDEAAGFDPGAHPGDVVFPVLHGLWGEGGPMQDLLERDGRPYVGSGPDAARRAMDKVATKHLAAMLGIPAPEMGVLGPVTDAPSVPLPVVLKPTHEGSSVGLHLCRTPEQWAEAAREARADTRATGRAYLVERLIRGRELTVPLLGVPGRGLGALPVVEITPAEGVYDYAAKYQRDDTRYTVEPDLADGLTARLHRDAVRLAEALGVRDLARVDFILPTDGEDAGTPQLLEVNTMPGFTSHSLLPKSALRVGTDFTALCAQLVELALERGVPQTR